MESSEMTGTNRTSAELDPRRRRILFRAWHRGIREMDLIFGQFADTELRDLPEAELDEFERILGEDDNELFKWICGEQILPERLRTPFFARIAAFRPEEAFAAGASNT
jgi:antitoxin CptB